MKTSGFTKVSKFDGMLNLKDHYLTGLNKNHYVGPYCRILNCNKYGDDGKGYCNEHSSALRSGIVPGMAGSSLVVKTTPKKVS